MLGKFIKFPFSRKKPESKTSEQQLATAIKGRSQQFLDFIIQKANQAKDEISTIRKKCDNLLETNFTLGMKHLDNGHLNEATFRFKFIKKFWPNHLESYYQLAYCLILKDKFDEAQKVLEELIQKDPSYENDAQELLDIIISAKEHNSPNIDQSNG